MANPIGTTGSFPDRSLEHSSAPLRRGSSYDSLITLLHNHLRPKAKVESTKGSCERFVINGLWQV